MTKSTNLADYDTRNPMAIALWAFNSRAVWRTAFSPETFDKGYAAGRMAAMNILLEGILGKRSEKEQEEHLRQELGGFHDADRVAQAGAAS